jgi:hypothetical protein
VKPGDVERYSHELVRALDALDDMRVRHAAAKKQQGVELDAQAARVSHWRNLLTGRAGEQTEALALLPGDYDPETGEVHPVKRKGGR